jgi:hypothetical protein
MASDGKVVAAGVWPFLLGYHLSWILHIEGLDVPVSSSKNLSIVLGNDMSLRSSGVVLSNGFQLSSRQQMWLTAGVKVELSYLMKRLICSRGEYGWFAYVS